MTPASSLRRSFRARPRAGTGITALFLAGLAVSAAAGFIGTSAEPATAKPAAAEMVPHTIPNATAAKVGQRS